MQQYEWYRINRLTCGDRKVKALFLENTWIMVKHRIFQYHTILKPTSCRFKKQWKYAIALRQNGPLKSKHEVEEQTMLRWERESTSEYNQTRIASYCNWAHSTIRFITNPHATAWLIYVTSIWAVQKPFCYFVSRDTKWNAFDWEQEVQTARHSICLSTALDSSGALGPHLPSHNLAIDMTALESASIKLPNPGTTGAPAGRR